jgi:hypothetical protein
VQPPGCLAHAPSHLAYAVLYTFRESIASKSASDDIALDSLSLTVSSRHFRKGIVMRNFIYSLTLVALAFAQVAIVVSELAHA